MSKEENAKPCPFCGSTELEPGGSEGDTEEWVQCTECGGQGPYATIGCRDPDEEEVDLEAEAVVEWNKRASADAPVVDLPQAVRDRLAEVAMEFAKQQRHDLQEVVKDLWSLLQGTYLAALKQRFGPMVVAQEAPPLRPMDK